jgi:hypothetical protein
VAGLPTTALLGRQAWFNQTLHAVLLSWAACQFRQSPAPSAMSSNCIRPDVKHGLPSHIELGFNLEFIVNLHIDTEYAQTQSHPSLAGT